MSYRDKEGYYEASQYLGQRVGKKNKFLQKTACMDQQTRELIASIEFVKTVGNDEDRKELEEIEPYFEMLGYARWQRDVISDFALFLGISEIGKKKAYTRDGSRPTNGSKQDL